ncbi:MAG: hypothetical protein H6985_17310 [Pseudomonadales bacterium]|nr:hypothetical protein [Pseudomonadales bacterium]
MRDLGVITGSTFAAAFSAALMASMLSLSFAIAPFAFVVALACAIAVGVPIYIYARLTTFPNWGYWPPAIIGALFGVLSVLMVEGVNFLYIFMAGLTGVAGATAFWRVAKHGNAH